MTDRDLGQLEVELQALRHVGLCRRPRCFVRDARKITYFHHVLPPDGDVPDSLQEGHGVTILIEANHVHRFYSKPGQPDLTCVAVTHGAKVCVRCNCPNPAPHDFLVDAACKTYNKT